MTGKVTIAGAGPGELEHLTIAVLKAIKSADVILYDALVNQSIIDEFPPSAEAIFVGKRCGQHAYTQTMVIAAMIEYALAGKNVLRLKGGDPAIFAHLAEELKALDSLGIEVRVLPGVTAMLTAAADLQRPLTMRGSSRHIWIADGHAEDIDRYALQMAKFPGTLVFYMAAGRCQNLAQLLLAHGIHEKKPCVLIENAGSKSRQIHFGTVLDAVNGKIVRAGKGPGIFLVGEALGDWHTVEEKDHAYSIQL